jgi:hypothetical protein
VWSPVAGDGAGDGGVGAGVQGLQQGLHQHPESEQQHHLQGEHASKSPTTAIANSPPATAAATTATPTAHTAMTGTQAGLAHWMSVMAEHMNSEGGGAAPPIHPYMWQQNGMEVGKQYFWIHAKLLVTPNREFERQFGWEDCVSKFDAKKAVNGTCHVIGNYLPFKGKSHSLSSQAARFFSFVKGEKSRSHDTGQWSSQKLHLKFF